MAANLQDIVNYYVDRMASIYRSKPKASAQIALFTKQLLADNLASELNLAFDIDQAYGEQLDTVGKYIGQSRNIDTPDFRVFFGFVNYSYPSGDQNLHGFTSYGSIDLNADAVFLRYQTQALAITQLTDFSYKQLLGFKILSNFSNLTMAEIQNQISLFFNGQLKVRDNKDMSLTYFYSRAFQLPVAVLTSAFPRPMGVKVNAFSFPEFDIYANNVAVFNSETPPYPTLDFGTGEFFVTRTIRIVNVGTLEFSLTGFTLTTGQFELTPSNPTASLLPGEELTFELTASSLTPGTKTDFLIFHVESLMDNHIYGFNMKGNLTGPATRAFSLGFSTGFN